MADHATDTIAALATAPGGALAILRLSGPAALQIADRAFRGTSSLAHRQPFTVAHGWIVNHRDERIDEVLATVFHSPHSYTGEDLIEFSCHGGALVTRRILETLVAAGARMADPGEYTRRAFLNGRIDLSQAEAVADIIRSTSDRAHRASIEQLQGRLGERVREIRRELLEVTAMLELEIDFAEEGIDLISRAELGRRLGAFRRTLEEARDSYRLGRIYREGVSVAIVGKPNAGKSSIFNALLRSPRAIVTEIPGTTRDTLEESIVLEGVLMRLTDTAGLRESTDPVEREGVERSRTAIETSDIILVVVDASRSSDPPGDLASALPPDYAGRAIVLFNKSDLVGGSRESVQHAGGTHRVLWTSALTGEGLEEVRQKLVEQTVGESRGGFGELIVTSPRHRDAFDRAAASVGSAEDALKGGASNEFAAFDIREAVAALAEITGEVTSEELLNHIFGSFCIGK